MTTTRIFPCVRCTRPAPKLKVEGEYLCLECQAAFRDFQATETAKAAYNRRATRPQFAHHPARET